MSDTSGPVPVVLAGARGHGQSHLRNIRRLRDQGLVELAGVCELTPLREEELAGLGNPEQSDDLGRLLKSTGARIAIICTPIHTHTALAVTAARHGAHVLLEKPPAPSLASFEELTEGVREAGVSLQIGFQSLGSHAIDAIRALVAGGGVGTVRGIGAAGAWVRDEAYWRRSPWGGRRSLDGVDVVDGVLTNPLAHAVATALRIDGSDRAEDIGSVELELYRINAIEADDTSCVRLRTAAGRQLVTAVTLCAERPADPYVVVHGDAGKVTLWYKTDRVELERDGEPVRTADYPRTDLLANLVAHVRYGTELLVPPERVGGFMRLVEAVRTAPDPVPLPEEVWHIETAADAARSAPGAGGAVPPAGPRRVLPGIDAATDAGAGQLALYSELGLTWARPPHVTKVA
jgi:predicted dehydrogenase